MLDILKVDGINTFLWFAAFARNDANPKGVSRSKLIKTGLAVTPLVYSTLNIFPSFTSPELLLKFEFHKLLAFSAISPLDREETFLPPL